MTRKEQNIILDRLDKLQSTVNYNSDLYRQTGDEVYNTYADLYQAMLFGVRGIAIELGLVGEDYKRKGCSNEKKEVMIKITFTDGDITLDGENLQKLTEDDIIDSIKVLVSLAMIMFGGQKGDSTNGNA